MAAPMFSRVDNRRQAVGRTCGRDCASSRRLPSPKASRREAPRATLAVRNILPDYRCRLRIMPKGSFFSILPVIRDMPGETREGRPLGKSCGLGGDGKMNDANFKEIHPSCVCALLKIRPFPIRVHPRNPRQMANADYSWVHTNPKRKRDRNNHLSSFTLRAWYGTRCREFRQLPLRAAFRREIAGSCPRLVAAFRRS
jgi:hypothetical protein